MEIFSKPSPPIFDIISLSRCTCPLFYEVPLMKRERKSLVYDNCLKLEAYWFSGVQKPFPSHFHEYYVIGLIEAGERRMECRGEEYLLGPGAVILLNPGDSHGCAQSGEGSLDYRAFNIPKEVVGELAGEIMGKEGLLGFKSRVAWERETAWAVGRLHRMVMEGAGQLQKEEGLFLLMEWLFARYGQPFSQCIPACGREIMAACAYMEEHFAERICLEELCRAAGLSKSALLRAFAREKGVTPYRYLENIRIDRAKKLLEQGRSPAQAAVSAGFFDQSHFTNYFSRFIGMPPGMYREMFWDRGGEEGE